jgi:ribonuclease J
MYAGGHTIGGVIVAIEYGSDRVLLEFGTAYEPKTDLFDGRVLRRDKNCLRDKLRIGILPKIDGIYPRDALGEEALVAAEDSKINTAVFITHLHLDHMSQINMLSPKVKVYMHSAAQTIERALEAVGKGAEGSSREYCELLPDVPVNVGAISVYPILCSNESYKDFAFLVETPDGVIQYTGDLTLHGLDAELTFRQMRLAKEKGVDVLLCDCTSFMDDVMNMMFRSSDAKVIPSKAEIPEGMLSGKEYFEGLFNVLENRKGLCVFNYYMREMADAKRFIDWAESLGRICAFEPEAAYIVYKFYGIEPFVYIPDSTEYHFPDGSEPPWFSELMRNCRIVLKADIIEKPDKYFLHNSYAHILELLDFPRGSYIHADGEPMGSFDPAYANMRKIVDMCGFEYVLFGSEHYFGHGYPQQVKYFVDEIDPKVLIPCHSYNPERLLPKNGVQLLPEPYEKFTLRNHVLIRENWECVK